MPSVLPDSDLYAFSLDDFDLWFFFSPCVVFAHMYVQEHTPIPMCIVARGGCWSAPLLLQALFPLDSLSLSPELTIVCLGWRANPSNPPLSRLPTGTYIWLFAWVLGPELKPLCLSSTYPLRCLSSPLVCFFDDKKKIFFLINLLGFHPVYFDHASPNSLLSSMPHPN